VCKSRFRWLKKFLATRSQHREERSAVGRAAITASCDGACQLRPPTTRRTTSGVHNWCHRVTTRRLDDNERRWTAARPSTCCRVPTETDYDVCRVTTNHHAPPPPPPAADSAAAVGVKHHSCLINAHNTCHVYLLECRYSRLRCYSFAFHHHRHLFV